MINVGVDIEDNNRFLDKDEKFLNRIFTSNEIQYCSKFKNNSANYCARFCAKEATIKALSNIYQKIIPYNKIEILKNSNGSVYVNILIDELKKYDISLSISHEKDKSIAFVIVKS